MDRNEILKRVFSNSGLTEMEEGYPSSTLPTPSEQYPYSRPQGREWAYNPPSPGSVTPGPAQWYGGKTGAGGLGGLILPSLSGANPADMPYEMPMEVPLSQPNYVSQSAADSSANAQQKAQEQIQKQKQIEKEIQIGKQPATQPIIKDQPFEKPQIKREELPQMRNVSLRPQAEKETEKIDTSVEYPEAKAYQEQPQRYRIESKFTERLDTSKNYPEAKTIETLDTSINYPEAKRQSIIEKVYPVKSNETIDAVSSADMKSTSEQVKPQKKSESFWDYALNYQTRKNEYALANPLQAAAAEIGSAAIAAPVLGGIGSALAVPAAATPIASNILQFPTAQSFPSETASSVGGKLLQFAPRAAGAAAAVASALPGSVAAESNWNPKTQKYTQPTNTNKVNNKAMATKTITPSTASTPSTPSTAPSTPSSVSNLLNKLNSAIKGLNIGR